IQDGGGNGAADGGSIHLQLREGGSSGQVGIDDVSHFNVNHTIRPNSVLLRDYDFEKPLLDLRAEASANDGAATNGDSGATGAAGAVGATGGTLLVYDHRGEHNEMEVNPPRATQHLEQHRARTQVGTGESTFPYLAPGYRFNLDAAGILNLS